MIGTIIKFKTGVTTDDGEIDLGGKLGTIEQYIHSRRGNMYFASVEDLEFTTVSVYKEDFEVVS